MKDLISVVDFGSSKITVLAGKKEVNNSFKLLSFADCEYEGFANGEFVDPNNLKEQMLQAINKVERELMCKLDTIFVGVPAEFCFVYEKMLVKTFAKSTKITPKIIDNMYLEDDETTCDTIFEKISELLNDEEKLLNIQNNSGKLAKPDATLQIVEQLKRVASGE